VNHALNLTQSLLVDVVRLAIWLVLLTIIFVPLERWFALRDAPGGRRLPADIGLYFLNSLVPAALLGVPMAVVAGVAARLIPSAYLAAVDNLPFVVRLLLGLIVAELGTYWAHRWTHVSPFLWQFHAVHHAPRHVNWLINTRAHPFDVVFTRLCGLVPLYLLGLSSTHGDSESQMLPVYITLFGAVWAFFIHANIRWRLGPLEWLVASPAFHHWHHTNDEHRDHNFAALIPLIDRIFGTHHLPKHWPPCYGIDAELPASTTRQLLEPFGLMRPPPPVQTSAPE
jgi:sterol desaturase/sphingolipid hydroxylase (fatty acid hydroxylase superfamily)